MNTTTGVGTVSGQARIDTTDGRHTSFAFEGVLTHGSLVGLAEGRSRPGRDEVKLLANLSADYSAAGGFANGKLGGGTAAGDAVLITPGGCNPPEGPAARAREGARRDHGGLADVDQRRRRDLRRPDQTMQGAVAKLKITDVVTIECDVANGASTLTKVSSDGHDRR